MTRASEAPRILTPGEVETAIRILCGPRPAHEKAKAAQLLRESHSQLLHLAWGAQARKET